MASNNKAERLTEDDEIIQLELEAVCFRVYLERHPDAASAPTTKPESPAASSSSCLSVQQKVLISTSMLGEIHHECSQAQRLHQAKVDIINISLEETELRLEDLEKDTLVFNTEVVKNDVGKKVERYYQARLIALESKLERLRLQRADKKRKLQRLKVQLKQRDSAGHHSIHFLDFRQLQIDKKKHVQLLTDRISELGRIKLREANKSKQLINIEKSMILKEKEMEKVDRALSMRKNHLSRLDGTIAKNLMELKKHSAPDCFKDNEKCPNNEGSAFDIMEMVSHQGELYKLRNELKVWQRKVKIVEAKLNAMSAKGVHIHMEEIEGTCVD